MPQRNRVGRHASLIGQNRVLATDRQGRTTIRRTAAENFGAAIIGYDNFISRRHTHNTSGLGQNLKHLIQVIPG